MYTTDDRCSTRVLSGRRTTTRNSFNTWSNIPLDDPRYASAFEIIPAEDNEVIYYAQSQLSDSESDFIGSASGHTFSNGRGVLTYENAITEIPANAFNSTPITSVILPDGVITICNSAFKDCDLLESVTMGGNVNTIEQYAFSGCLALNDITLPASLRSLEAKAFQNCISLETINIPNLSGMGANPFAGCTGLTSFTGRFVTSDGKFIFFNAINQGMVISCALGAFTNQLVELPEGAKGIASNAFSGGSFRRVIIPATVTNISADAFAACDISEGLWFEGDNLPSIAARAFGGGTGDTDTNFSIYISGWSTIESADVLAGSIWNNYKSASVNRVVVYQDYDEIWYHGGSPTEAGAIIDFDGNTNVNQTDACFTNQYRRISSRVRRMPEFLSAWSSQTATVEMHILKYASEVYSVGYEAFYGSTVDYVSLPDCVRVIGNRAFMNCASLTAFPSPGSYLQTIGSYAFYGCPNMEFANANHLYMPRLTSLGAYAFYGCTSFGSGSQGCMLKIGQVPSIPDYAFYGCETLTDIYVCNPDDSTDESSTFSILSIGEKAFYGCENLASFTCEAYFGEEEVFIPRATTIGPYAFYGCESLSLACVGAVSMFDEGVFRNCTSLEAVLLFTRNLTSVKAYAFDGCSSLKEVRNYGVSDECVDLPYVQTVGVQAFSRTNVKSVTMDQATVLGLSAFAACPRLTDLSFPSLVSIESSAFMSCSTLTDVTIPASVTSIGSYAFKNCTNLWRVFFDDLAYSYELPSLGTGAFDNTPSYLKLSICGVGGTTIYSYEATHPWRVYADKIEVYQSDQEIWYIGYNTVNGVTYPAAADGTLLNNTNQTMSCASYSGGIPSPLAISPNVPVPASVSGGIIVDRYHERIYGVGANAFKDNSNAVYISLPQLVRSIGTDAFRNCTSLVNFPALSNQWTGSNVLSSIGSGAFYNCPSLTGEVNAPYVTSMGVNTFGAHKITSFDLPSIVSIGYQSLGINTTATSSSSKWYVHIGPNIANLGLGYNGNGDSQLCLNPNALSNYLELTIDATSVPSVTSGTFYGINFTGIKVPATSVDAYRTAWAGKVGGNANILIQAQ